MALLYRMTALKGLRASWLLEDFAARILGSHVTGFRSISTPAGPYKPSDTVDVEIVRKKGIDLIHDPLFNKGTAFPVPERERLELRGLLPKKCLSMQAQVDRFMEDYELGKTYIDPKHVADGGVTPDHVRRWKVLQELQDRNETLFYKILLDNFVEMAPIVYTPTVGWACLNFHKLYRRPRGMYFDATDKGEMASMVWNWPANEVDAIVVTDGSRILGLGDLGLNGLGIPIGKLDLYVAAAGFNPGRILPVVLDVGTSNRVLKEDPLYLGLNQERMSGPEYYEIMDELVKALMGRYPNAVLQFEDFNMEHATPLLDRYRDHHLCFNDDIQGTAATAVAGVYGALRVQGKSNRELAEQRIVLVGAGSAGMGVARMLALGMVKQGLSYEEATSNFWVLDADGLVTVKREKQLSATVEPFARKTQADPEGEKLVDTVKRVKPTVLIGLAGAGKLFVEEILQTMGQHNERPIIMPMSNPTHRMECNAEEAQRATGGRAIFASGSPCNDVEYKGRIISSSQANNLYIFPGLALGAHLGATKVITDEMLMAAAEALGDCIPDEDLDKDIVYPRLKDIRYVSMIVAKRVMRMAYDMGHLHSFAAKKSIEISDDELEAYVKDHMFEPVYKPLVNLPVGVQE